MNKEKYDIEELIEKFGVIGAIRHMEKFDNGGKGDYTKEKYELLEPTYEEMNEFLNSVNTADCVSEDTIYVAKDVKECEYESRVDFKGLYHFMKDNDLEFDDLSDEDIKKFIRE